MVVLVVLVVFVGSRRSLAGLESSGRSVGRISTWWRPPKLPWSRVMTKKELDAHLHHDYLIFNVFLFSDDFQPVLAMKFIVESEFQGQGPPKPREPPEPP